MKRYIFMLALASSAMPASAQGLSAGVFIGSPMSGVSIAQHNLRVSIGIEENGVAVDGTFNLGDWLARPEFSPVYAYTGAQWVDDKHHKWGPRAGLGIAVPMGHGDIELYGEAGTTWYWQDDAAFKFEGAFGLRMFF
ncbi:hypothetical protein D515_04178 [Grimontia indica]|uniref:Outer membrane protein beta-barrel domain-containing protein n=1 Tax=Grimontia indica TaxID=1056512 RepID=R1IUW1_9GAMM|nr:MULTISPECIES: hypothetical protein [Grimontia]EOD81277.1 hypothetical protein D515_04178 [Grimontia indica]